jgi:hypothetical protein
MSHQPHAPTALTEGGKPSGTHWTGDCAGPRAGLDSVPKRKIPALPCPIVQHVILEIYGPNWNSLDSFSIDIHTKSNVNPLSVKWHDICWCTNITSQVFTMNTCFCGAGWYANEQMFRITATAGQHCVFFRPPLEVNISPTEDGIFSLNLKRFTL